MINLIGHQLSAVREPQPLLEPDLLPKWYAVYTFANHEKRVKEQLDRRLVESFLPLYDSVRRWKDRRVRLQLPLFPSYVFVRLALRERWPVLQLPGVARLVGFNGSPAALPESEVEALQRIAPTGLHVQPHRYLSAGRRVRVKAGPLAGIEGVLVRKKNGDRFVVSVDLIMRSVALEVDALDLEPN
jgi:transcription antitermination factor NusG